MFGLTGDDWTAIELSLRIAVVATVASLPFGILVAYGLARWEFPGKSLVNGIVHLPLVLPPVVTGYVLLLAFGRRGIFGAALEKIGIVLAFRWTGAALACAIMGFPLMVRAMRLSFETIDVRLEAGGRHARRRPAVALRAGDAAAGDARAHRRRDPGLRPRARRSSAPPSPSSRTSPARRRRSPRRSTPTCRTPTATPERCGSRWCPSSSRWLR